IWIMSTVRSPFYFFFSSRRRHTRFSRDWSSDVCSSDLYEQEQIRKITQAEAALKTECEKYNIAWTILRPTMIYGCGLDRNVSAKIGRATCRERGDTPTCDVYRDTQSALFEHLYISTRVS